MGQGESNPQTSPLLDPLMGIIRKGGGCNVTKNANRLKTNTLNGYRVTFLRCNPKCKPCKP